MRPGSPGRGELISLRRRVDPYLYDGAAGIALFLAALSRVSASAEQRERSLAAIAPVRRKIAELATDPQRASMRIGIGGCIGLGSLLYCFLHIGELAGEPELRAEALAILPLLTPERIQKDASGDLLYGGASPDRSEMTSSISRRPALVTCWIAEEPSTMDRAPGARSRACPRFAA